MRGKDFIGRTVMGWSTGRSSMRVLQVRRGLPLTSAEHEPHFPALQFQRTAGSAPAPPGSCAPRRARPCPRQRRPGTPSARHAPACRGTAETTAVQPRLFPFLNEVHEIGGKRRLRLTPDRHAGAFLLYDDLLACLLV